VEVEPVVRSVLTAAGASPDQTGVQLLVAAGAERTSVMADERALSRVLTLLVQRGMQRSAGGGHIRVSWLKPSESRVSIVVCDGAATAPEEFPQADRLAESMGGEVVVWVHPAGGGAHHLNLPAAETRHHRPPDGAIRARRTYPRLDDETSPMTVVYVEDNPANLELVEEALGARAGVTLLTATRGLAGLDLARDALPDLVLLDLDLPDMGGEEVLRRLLVDRRTSHIPVVVVSADASPRVRRRLIESGAAAFVTKPLDIPRFLGLVDDPPWRPASDHFSDDQKELSL